MRIIAYNTVREYIAKFPETETALTEWHNAAKAANWANSEEVKEYAASVSILSNNRVCFNIRGNQYRMIVSINYDNGIVYIKWFGKHTDYIKIDAEEVGW